MELDRPIDAIGYIAENLRDIANQVLYSKARVNLPKNFPRKKITDAFQNDFNIPTIIFKPKKKYTTAEVLQKAKRFLKRENLDKKHSIFLNFPPDCKTSHDFLENNMSPNTVVELNYCGDACMDSALREYYGRRHHRLFWNCKSSPPNQEAKKSINEAMSHIMKILRNTKVPDTPYLRGCYFPRVIFIGRTGSGRKILSTHIANRFNLTLSMTFYTK